MKKAALLVLMVNLVSAIPMAFGHNGLPTYIRNAENGDLLEQLARGGDKVLAVYSDTQLPLPEDAKDAIRSLISLTDANARDVAYESLWDLTGVSIDVVEFSTGTIDLPHATDYLGKKVCEHLHKRAGATTSSPLSLCAFVAHTFAPTFLEMHTTWLNALSALDADPTAVNHVDPMIRFDIGLSMDTNAEELHIDSTMQRAVLVASLNNQPVQGTRVHAPYAARLVDEGRGDLPPWKFAINAGCEKDFVDIEPEHLFALKGLEFGNLYGEITSPRRAMGKGAAVHQSLFRAGETHRVFFRISQYHDGRTLTPRGQPKRG